MPFLFWVFVGYQLISVFFVWMAIDTAQREVPHLRTMNGSLERLADTLERIKVANENTINSQEKQIAILTETIELLKTPNQQP